MPPYNVEWLLDGNVVSTVEDPANLLQGDYTIRITDGHGCVAEFGPITIGFISAVQAVSRKELSLNVFPNPTTGKLQVDLSDLIWDDISVSIWDVLGTTVYQREGPPEQGITFHVDLSGNAAGIYFIHLLYEGESVTQKIILHAN